MASMASATSALRMRGADVDCSRISVRPVRSHPSREATGGSVSPSPLAPCLTRWRREGWHRLGHPLDNLGIRGCLALRQYLLDDLDRALDLLIRHRLDRIAMLDLVLTGN